MTKFQIKKNSWVFVPTQNARIYGKTIKSLLEDKWSIPSYYFHLRLGGHVEALKSHLNNSFFLHLDIKDFFGCINKSRITRNLKIYFGYTLAREIASYSTVKHPDYEITKYILPFGFVQSPIIASLCLEKSRLGKYLENLKKSQNVIVSVYMDDIIISGVDEESLIQILFEINVISKKSNFPLNPDKQEGPSKKVTAFNIELSHQSLEITKEKFHEFSYRYHFELDDDVRNGIMGYILSVNVAQAEKL